LVPGLAGPMTIYFCFMSLESQDSPLRLLLLFLSLVGEIAPLPHQHSLSWFWVLHDSWPYLAVAWLWESCNSSLIVFSGARLLPINSSWHQAPWDSRPAFFFQLNPYSPSPYVTSSLMRRWVCHLQWLLVLASTGILGSESRRTRDQILLSQVWDSCNLEGLVPIFYVPQEQGGLICTQVQGSIFVTSYNSQGYGGGIQTCLHAC
jgi:hypothetical protein